MFSGGLFPAPVVPSEVFQFVSVFMWDRNVIECWFLFVFCVRLCISIRFSDGTTIKSVSENVVASPGDEATLSCTVEGKPLTDEHVRWERIGYDMKKTEITFANGTSYLHIKNAQREDVGNFRCVADNRVANPTSRDVLLVVKCKFSVTFSQSDFFVLRLYQIIIARLCQQYRMHSCVSSANESFASDKWKYVSDGRKKLNLHVNMQPLNSVHH